MAALLQSLCQGFGWPDLTKADVFHTPAGKIAVDKQGHPDAGQRQQEAAAQAFVKKHYDSRRSGLVGMPYLYGAAPGNKLFCRNSSVCLLDVASHLGFQPAGA